MRVKASSYSGGQKPKVANKEKRMSLAAKGTLDNSTESKKVSLFIENDCFYILKTHLTSSIEIECSYNKHPISGKEGQHQSKFIISQDKIELKIDKVLHCFHLADTEFSCLKVTVDCRFKIKRAENKLKKSVTVLPAGKENISTFYEVRPFDKIKETKNTLQRLITVQKNANNTAIKWAEKQNNNESIMSSKDPVNTKPNLQREPNAWKNKMILTQNTSINQILIGTSDYGLKGKKVDMKISKQACFPLKIDKKISQISSKKSIFGNCNAQSINTPRSIVFKRQAPSRKQIIQNKIYQGQYLCQSPAKKVPMSEYTEEKKIIKTQINQVLQIKTSTKEPLKIKPQTKIISQTKISFRSSSIANRLTSRMDLTKKMTK